MKTNINLIVTVDSDDLEDADSLPEQVKAIETFCRIKNQHGCEVNGRKLTFVINSSEVFCVD